METSHSSCEVALNAGFFDTHTFACHGNLVSDGEIVQNTIVQNVNFGITRNGTFVVGYLSKEDVLRCGFSTCPVFTFITSCGWPVATILCGWPWPMTPVTTLRNVLIRRDPLKG